MRAVALLVMLATAAHAGKPIPFTMKGCVLAGVFYDMDDDGAAIVKLTNKKLDLAKYEGKQIVVNGSLNIGDRFTPGTKPPIVKGDCTSPQRKLAEYAKAHDLRLQGGRLASEGKIDEAFKLVDAAIKLVQPADCDAFIDRAQLFAKKTDLASAEKDIGVLKTKTCRFRGALNWLLLQELATDLRAKQANQLAIDALTLALEYCDGDLCKPDLERDLAAAKKAASQKKP